jgi:hypothetical protein
MLNIIKALDKGAPFFSFIIGLGIAAILFHRKFQVVRTLSVPLSDVTTTLTKSDGKCYRFRVEDATCEFPSSL